MRCVLRNVSTCSEKKWGQPQVRKCTVFDISMTQVHCVGAQVHSFSHVWHQVHFVWHQYECTLFSAFVAVYLDLLQCNWITFSRSCSLSGTCLLQCIACCSVLPVAVYCLLQCIADCCRLLQIVAMSQSELQWVALSCGELQYVAGYYSLKCCSRQVAVDPARSLQHACCSVCKIVAVCCILSQCVADCRSMLHIVAVCCILSQCVAVCSRSLQCVALCCSV